jgi:hypothetical protein
MGLRGRGSLVWAAALLVVGQIGLGSAPFLVDRAPLLLLLLRPQTEMILLLGGVLPPLVIVLVAAPLRLLFHVVYYELGRWGGERFVARSRAGRWALARMRYPMVGRALIFSCLIHQSTPVDLALGSRGSPRRMVVPVLASGVLLSTLLLAYIGTELAPLSRKIIALLRDHPVAAAAVLSAIGLVTLALAVHHYAPAIRRPQDGREERQLRD